MTRVLVTGATGFIGSVLCEALARADYLVRAALRTDRAVPVAIAEKVIVGDINSTTDWTQALQGVDLVIPRGCALTCAASCARFLKPVLRDE